MYASHNIYNSLISVLRMVWSKVKKSFFAKNSSSTSIPMDATGGQETVGRNHRSNSKVSLAEDELLRMGHLALLSMQLPGYLPIKTPSVSLSTGDTTSGLKSLQLLRLPLDFNSAMTFLHSLWCFTSLGLSIATCGFAAFKGYKALESVAGEKHIFSEGGDRVVVTYGLICSLIMITICRIIFLKNRQELMQFWTSRMVQLHEEFARLNFSYAIADTEIQVKRLFVFFWTVSAVQIGLAVVYTYIGRLIDDKGEITNSAVNIHSTNNGVSYVDYDNAIILVLLLLMYIHSGPVIWMGFILKFYTNCLKAVAHEIRRVNHKLCVEMETGGWCSSFYDRTYGLVSVSTIGKEWRDKVSVKANLTGKSAEELLQLIELYEQVGEAVESFNKFYGVIVLIDVFVGVTNALGFVYTVNKLMYELGDHSSGHNLLILFRAPFYLSQVFRLVYFTNQGDSLAEYGMSVLRELRKVPMAVWAHKSLLHVKVEMLVTKESSNPVILCPSNSLTLSRKLLASLFSFLATYYIILTEFREEDEGRNFIRNLNFSCGSL